MMRTDSTVRYSRSVVRLVILTVAVPSLLLTAMGVLAVANEEIAARDRRERVFKPVLGGVAKAFNDEMDALVTEAAEPQPVEVTPD